jgi:hypothetical protein
MKKLTYLLTISVLTISFFQACKKKEEVPPVKEENKDTVVIPPAATYPKTKNALFLYFSGSQCNPCGSAGIPNYNNVLAATTSKVVPVVVHCNAPAYDSLYETVAGGELLSLIISNNSYSAPTFVIPPNPMFSGAASNSASAATGYINAFAAAEPDASSMISASVNAGVLEVKTKTKFFKDVNGLYKVGVLVLEDGVVFEQIANGQKIKPYTHDDVLRARLSTSAFGDVIVNGAVTAEQVFEKAFTRKLPTGVSKLKTWNPANLTIVCIVWKHTGTGTSKVMEVVNVQQIDL